MKIQKTLMALLVLIPALCVFPTASDGKQASPKKSISKIEKSPLIAPISGIIVLADARQLTADEMQNLRGGFIDPTGLIYNFAVDVRAALGGGEIFTRSLTVSPSGPGGHFEATRHTALSPQNAPTGFNVSMIGDGSGVLVTDTNGSGTKILNQTASGAPASIILNATSSNNVAQTVNMTLTLKNMSSIIDFARTTVHAVPAPTANMHFLGF